MSARSLEVVQRWSEHAQRQHAPSDHTACAGWADSTHTLQNTRHPSTTAAHVLKPCSAKCNRVPSTSSCHKRLFASRSRSTLSVGSHAKLRLVPIVLIAQALPACASQLRHHCRIPCRDGSAIPDTLVSVMLS